VIVAAAVSFGLTSPGAVAATPPALSSTVVVTASATSFIEVRLTRSVKIAEAVAPSLKVTGGGFTAIGLIRVMNGSAPPGLVVTRLAGTSTWHHHWVGHERGTDDDDDRPTFFTRMLPPGRYRLYVATTGATTVAWRLPLGSGTTRLAPRTRTTWTSVGSTVAGQRGTLAAPGHAEQQTATFAHRGLGLSLAWYRAHADVEATLGGCMYPGDPSTLGLGPLPACQDRDASTGPVGPAVEDFLVVQGGLLVGPGKWTNKAYFRVTGAVKDGGVSVSMLDLGGGFPAA
jgi:hypothetical protein